MNYSVEWAIGDITFVVKAPSAEEALMMYREVIRDSEQSELSAYE